jgi:hypothetical protein
VSLNPAGTLDFGNINSATVTSTMTVAIGGGGAVTFGTAMVTDGTGPGTYSKGTDTCSNNTVGVGNTCAIAVILVMPGNGSTASVGTLTVPHNGSGSAATLNLTGR